MPAFDAHRPPELDVIETCVHCGFCLPTCPTYTPLWNEEMDSPRGRIVLMQEGLEGANVLSDEMVKHFDRCLGCLACVTACPSGVRYDRLIERTRAQVERHHRRSPGEWLFRRLVFGLFPHPRRLRVLAPSSRSSGSSARGGCFPPAHAWAAWPGSHGEFRPGAHAGSQGSYPRPASGVAESGSCRAASRECSFRR